MKQLRMRGIGRSDRLAIVLSNGAEMAATFLGVASGAISAPLNPSYGFDEFTFYLSDLNAKALIIHEDLDSPVREVALRHGVSVIDMSPQIEAPAERLFSLKGSKPSPGSVTDFCCADDLALMLRTSGPTTRIPKRPLKKPRPRSGPRL